MAKKKGEQTEAPVKQEGVPAKLQAIKNGDGTN